MPLCLCSLPAHLVTYLRDTLLSHPPHHLQGLVGCAVAPPTEMEAKGPVWGHVWPTYQLNTEKQREKRIIINPGCPEPQSLDLAVL